MNRPLIGSVGNPPTPMPAPGETTREVPAGRDTFEAIAEARAAALNEQVASCHEAVACPRCGMPVGVECRRVRRVGAHPYPDGRWSTSADPPLKHPHRERWTLVVPER